jgi:cysteine synthase A
MWRDTAPTTSTRGSIDDVDPLLDAAVGGTPLVRLEHVVPDGCGDVWVKVESRNPTGSYKDRMAVSVIDRALERGDLGPGDRVVEYTGGSTGTALAFVAARRGLRMLAVSSDAFAPVKLRSMRAYGAEVAVEPSDGGLITPDLIARMRDLAYAVAEERGSFYADQFGSPDVRAGYRPMGAEIARQAPGPIDVLCAGVGTGGALMGTMDGLAEAGGHPDVIALEPLQSPLLTTGEGGPHRVEGIGVGFAPPFLERDRCSDIRAVDEQLAFAMCRRLAAEEGLLCGPSTGLNVTAAIDLARERGPGSTVVTLACDDGAKYLDSDLFA